MSKNRLTIGMEPEDLAKAIIESSSHEEALDILQIIDLGMQDYDFTLNLARWCGQERSRIRHLKSLLA